ncbi:MAG: hypothetical protein R3F43_30040 [bacterium]
MRGALGAAGFLLVRVASGSLAGRTVTVHEVADRPAERFEVWTCPGPVLDGQCAGPWFSGGDGEVASGRWASDPAPRHDPHRDPDHGGHPRADHRDLPAAEPGR